MRYLGFVTLAFYSALLVSCDGGSERPTPLTVTGAVSFAGKPVGTGNVMFEDASTGTANSAALSPEGTFSVDVPPGSYKVTVTPILTVTPDTATSPGGEKYAEADDIPEKYRSTDSTDLSASVSESSRKFVFELKP